MASAAHTYHSRDTEHSGLMPLRSMMRQRLAVDSDVPLRLLYSARTIDDVIYADELTRADAVDGVDVRLTLTRVQPDGWRGYARRTDREMLADVAWPATERPHPIARSAEPGQDWSWCFVDEAAFVVRAPDGTG